MWDAPNVNIKCLTLRLNDTTKGVDKLRQQDGGHGSRYPLRKV